MYIFPSIIINQAAGLQPRHSLDDLFDEAASDDQQIKEVPVPARLVEKVIPVPVTICNHCSLHCCNMSSMFTTCWLYPNITG